jgi:hypothetical protein
MTYLLCLHLPLVVAQDQLDPVALTQCLALCAVVVNDAVTTCGAAAAAAEAEA